MQTLQQRKADVSIIVPVYNLEHYLSPLLESLKAQETSPYKVEIIFVLNNCTDRSEDVIRDSGIDCTIMDCTIQGCGAARNAALDVATGEYIWFMDGDDWLLSKTAIYDAVTKMRNDHLDILRVPYKSDEFGILYFSMVWQYVMRRDFIGTLRFPNIQPGEDDVFMSAILAKAGYNKDTFFTMPHLTRPQYFYNYMRDGSNMFRVLRLGEKI